MIALISGIVLKLVIFVFGAVAAVGYLSWTGSTLIWKKKGK